jgi:hypothetical protein
VNEVQKAEIQPWLTYLNGATPEQVVAKLRAAGVKGKRAKPCECPVARFLQQKTSFNVAVGGTRVWIDGQESDPGITIPYAVRKAVNNFDSGLYSDLVG